MIRAIGLELKSYNFTDEGLQELRQSIAELKEQQRKLVHEMQDLHSQSTPLHTLEDSLYTIDQEQIVDMDRQITILERLVAMAHISQPDSCDTVQTGSTVTIQIEGEERIYTIVGPLEADPLRGKLSEESPLGQQLLGKRVLDIVAAPCPSNKHRTAKIVAIT